MTYFLAGDIGGTNCRYALFDGTHLSHIHTWPTQESSGLRYDVERYLSVVNIIPEAACVAIASPVVDAEVVLTNADWRGHPSDLPCKGQIINDLVAAAHGLSRTPKTLHICGPQPIEGPKVLLGVGTGFGQVLSVGKDAYPAEGGHASYAPSSPEQEQLFQFLRTRKRRVRVEDICSGIGLENILDYIVHRYDLRIDRDTPAGKMFAEQASSREEMALGLSLFLTSLASVIGDTALRLMPPGGIWLCGGVAQKMASHIQSETFLNALFDKAPMENIVRNIPVSIILESDLGLLGAADVAFRCS
ncbi:MAG: glucokinase [Myxococcota bacterium]|nr:glucokinase [Myxococcota bacterium]